MGPAPSIIEGTAMELCRNRRIAGKFERLWRGCDGRIVREAKVASEHEALTAWFKGLCFELKRIRLAAGPLSQWLYAGLKDAGLAVELLETRHVRNDFKIMPVKTDRKDARGIAQLIRMGWLRPVHCKSLPTQESRSQLGAGKLLQGKLHDIEMSLRGMCAGWD